MLAANTIISRKLAEEQLKAAKELSVRELHGVQADLLALKLLHDAQLLEELRDTHVLDLNIKRRCVRKKCFCPSHLSELMRERKIGVSG